MQFRVLESCAMLDLIVQGGILIDGTGNPRYRADLGVLGDRIQQIGDLTGKEARDRIDARGRAVAPGFVDVHNHSDSWLLSNPNFLSKTAQGFTTEVIMADGISYAPVDRETVHSWIYYLRSLNGLRLEEYEDWESLAEYMALLDGRTAQNSIPHIPYANVRALACGFGRQAPDDVQMAQILREIEKGMEAGAVGISTGLDYIAQCHASTDELVRACRVMAPQGLYATHMRYKMGILAALEEAVEIGKRAGVPVHISHLKAVDEPTAEKVLDYVDRVATQEVDFSFDVYPYLPGSTMLNFLMPYEIWDQGPLAALDQLRTRRFRDRLASILDVPPLDQAIVAWTSSKGNHHLQGMAMGDYISRRGLSPADAIADLLIEENLSILLVFHRGDDSMVEPFLSHSHYMMGSDGIYQEGGLIHPRHYGSGPRLLGPCVRDRKLFSLEEAVHKLSGYPSRRFGLRDRGFLKEGNFADLVVFDPDTVQDRATYKNPHQLPSGIDHVVINGVPVLRHSQPVEGLDSPLPGRALRFHQ